MTYLARFVCVLFLLAAPFAHAAEMPPPLAALAAKVAPAVVSITALSPTGHAVASGDDGGNMGAVADVEKPEGMVIPPPDTIESLGSGFIFEPSGYILTNNHVVQGATDVTVTLTNGMVYPAIIAGLDPASDLAVLKIDTGHPMPFLKFGDSSQMRVGDWVLAIGNPYGMSNTNTAGIVSALHRRIGDTQFDDFIQTDAAINKGNSGGPLLNMQGQVIGVNSAIYAPAGTSDGIGFSIPSAMAQPVADALVRNGKMDRGWLGVSTEEVLPRMQAALRLPAVNGALVGAVSGNGPAAGKLLPGDVITALNGAAIDNPRALFIRTAEIQAGQAVTVDYIRNGTPARATLMVTAPPTAQDSTTSSAQSMSTQPVLLSAYGLGLSGDTSATGVAVISVSGPAHEADIAVGDKIMQVNGVVVTSAAQIAKLVKKLGQDPAVFFVGGPVAGGETSSERWVVVARATDKTTASKPDMKAGQKPAEKPLSDQPVKED